MDIESSVERHDDHVSVIAIMCGSVVKPHLVLGHSNNITCIIIMTREGPKKFTLKELYLGFANPRIAGWVLFIERPRGRV